MVLHHIPDCAHLLVERAPALHAEVLRHSNLHAFDVGAVPERLEQGVGETEKQHAVNRLLSEVMVDSINGLFVKRFEKDLVEFPSRGEIATEWFLDDDPSVPGAGGSVELFHNHLKSRGWNRQIIGWVL